MSPARMAMVPVQVCAVAFVVVFATALAACSPQPGSRSERPSLRSVLARVGGSYEWNGDIKQYVFSDKLALEKLVGNAREDTIRALVDCLDDAQPSATMLKGQPVPVGVVCYQALSQIVYYEPTTADGDIAQRWPGFIEPTASAAELAAAKRVWTIVVEKNSYKRL